MPLSSTGMCRAASLSRIAVRFFSVTAGSTPRRPSFAPSSTMAASAPSPSDPVEPRQPAGRGVAGHRAVDDRARRGRGRAGRPPAAPRSRRRAAGRSRRTANCRAPAAAPGRRVRRQRPSADQGQRDHGFPPPAADAIWCRHGCHPAVSGSAGAGQEPASDRAFRRRAGQHPARHRSRHRGGRGGRHHRSVRLRQDQPADGAGRAGARQRRQHPAGRPGGHGDGRGRAGPPAPRDDRHRVPGVPPDPDHDRAGERRGAAGTGRRARCHGPGARGRWTRSDWRIG